MKKAAVPYPPVFIRPELFPIGDVLDELYKETATQLRLDLYQYLLDHDADLQDKVDQVVRDLLAGTDVRTQLDNKRLGRQRRQTARTLALAVEHARLVKNGIKKTKATKLLVAAMKATPGERSDDAALSKEIRRAIHVFD